MARRLVRGLAAEEVRVVLTARDLTRVVPSHWQESTQNRGTTPWSQFVEEVCAEEPASPDLRRAFWQCHHLPTIVRTWGSIAGDGKVTVVTIPASGSRAVWERFASVIEVPDEPGRESVDPGQTSEAALLDTALDGLAVLGERLAAARRSNDRLRRRLQAADKGRRGRLLGLRVG